MYKAVEFCRSEGHLPERSKRHPAISVARFVAIVGSTSVERNVSVKKATRGARRAAQTAAPNDFRLSRIQAEGWNAAHRAISAAPARSDRAAIDSLNPYPADPERARWTLGYNSALVSR
jgi:hypothetical protein